MTDHDHDSQDTPIEPETPSWRSWILGALFTVTIAFGSMIAHSLDTRLSQLEQHGSAPFRERIATVEARQVSLQRQQDAEAEEIRESMRRIEAKLDTALERLHSSVLSRR